MTPQEPRKVTLRVFKLLPYEKQELSVATEAMVKYKNEDVNFEYIDFVEYSAYEQAQAKCKELEWEIQNSNKFAQAQEDKRHELQTKVDNLEAELKSIQEKWRMNNAAVSKTFEDSSRIKDVLEVKNTELQRRVAELEEIIANFDKTQDEQIKNNVDVRMENARLKKALESIAADKYNCLDVDCNADSIARNSLKESEG